MFWDSIAWVYDIFADGINRKANRKLCKVVAGLISPTDDVLECACGTGLLSGVIAKRCKSLTATDFSAKMLARTRKKYGHYPHVRFEQADILHLPYPDARFDTVVAANVIHLLDNPHQALRELDRVCKPGGKLIIPTYMNRTIYDVRRADSLRGGADSHGRICGHKEEITITIVIQLVLYCFLPWLIVKVAVGNNAINGLYFYPKAFQECAISRGLIDRATVQKKRRNCMIALYVLLLVAPVLMIGVWNRVTDFWTAYGQGVLFLEVMNWFDGLVIDMLWVGHSKFWAIPKMEDVPYTQTWGQMLKKRLTLTVIWLVGAFIIAGLVMLMPH